MRYMDLEEQNNFAAELEKFVTKWLKDKPFHLIVAAETTPGNGFVFPISGLSSRTSFESCNLIVTGIADEADALIAQFEIPSDKKFKKPFEPK